MTILYECDFCTEDERKAVKHKPGSPHHTIVANFKPGAAVICEGCVRVAMEIIDNKGR